MANSVALLSISLTDEFMYSQGFVTSSSASMNLRTTWITVDWLLCCGLPETIQRYLSKQIGCGVGYSLKTGKEAIPVEVRRRCNAPLVTYILALTSSGAETAGDTALSRSSRALMAILRASSCCSIRQLPPEDEVRRSEWLFLISTIILLLRHHIIISNI